MTQALDYPDYVQALRADWPALAAEVAEFRGMERVLRWMDQRDLALGLMEFIGQDEYHYDLLIPFDPEGRWLVFGVTWLGGLTAVAVWPAKPTPDQLLHRRLQEGWTPTPSRLKDGHQILGHAACLTNSQGREPSQEESDAHLSHTRLGPAQTAHRASS